MYTEAVQWFAAAHLLPQTCRTRWEQVSGQDINMPDQRNVDRVFGSLRTADQLTGIKGRSVHTLETVERLLSESGEDLSAEDLSAGEVAAGEVAAGEVADRTGMSRATAQRYLTHLHELGRVTVQPRYGASGRPEHGYCWRPTTST